MKRDALQLTTGFGIGVAMPGTAKTPGLDGRALPAAELFKPDDVVVLLQGTMPIGFPQTPELMVERSLGGRAATLYALPCDVSQIPPHVKITREAAAFIRNGMRESLTVEETAAEPAS